MLPSISWHTIGLGRAGAFDTLHRMRLRVATECALPIVRLTAAGICRGTGTDSAEQIARIRAWCDRHVHFLRDPYGIELLHQPQYLLAQLGLQGLGGTVEVDCDDVAMLGAALGLAVGLRARFVMIGRDGGYEHVWAELADPRGGEWQELDITRPHQPDFSRYDLSLTIEV